MDPDGFAGCGIGHNREDLIPFARFVLWCEAAVDANWDLATSAQGGKCGAFGGDSKTGRGIIKEGDGGNGCGIILTSLNSQRPLAGSGTKVIRFKALADPFGLFQAIKAGSSQQNGIDLAFSQFAQACVDVAAEFDSLDVGPKGKKLGAATLAAGANNGTMWKGMKALVIHRDQHIAGINTRRSGCEHEGWGQFGGQILERVDGKIDAAFGQSFFDFLGEHTLGTDLRKGDFLQPVTGRLDDLDFDAVSMRAQKRGNVVGLPKSELRAAAAYAQIHLPPTALVWFSRGESTAIFSFGGEDT